MNTLENNNMLLTESKYEIGYLESSVFKKKEILLADLSPADKAIYDAYVAILPDGTLRNLMQVAPSQSGGQERYLSFFVDPTKTKVTYVSGLSPSDKAKYDAYKSLITTQIPN